MTSPRPLHGKWYEDACGTAFGMELIGERWSILVVRELMLGGRRFSDLRASLPGISAKVLAERLASLAATGVLVRRRLPPPAPAQVYELTQWGYLAEPVIQELGRWAARSPEHNPQLALSPVSFMLSLRTMLDREKAGEFEVSVGITLGGDSFLAELRRGELPVRRAAPGEGEIGLSAAVAPPLVRVVYGSEDPAVVAGRGELALRGDIELIRRFVALFALPAKLTAGSPPPR